ncbi:acyloxyacyl hydrolase [Salinibius halmophilus]|uniref:acyloxyacyl hydrolase n=1 Tax=Salinibius halmophilus TaxID=1853216 RepID=UPI000E662224|nr:acyloxyacyl hydrolase [Salinibius halmophilus]
MLRAVLLLLLPALCSATNTGVFLGSYDVARNNQDSQYGVTVELPQSLTAANFRPQIGILRSRYASHYVFAGILRRSTVFQRASTPYLELNFAPGLYFFGNQNDTDLGYWLQFRSGIEVGYRFSDQTKIGLAFHHLSNASLAEPNPGTETLSVHYRVNW